ncbi:MAG: hypothetical protein WC815_01170 [Vicinamibacterales bacterium]|jgi:hypothetical protein
MRISSQLTAFVANLTGRFANSTAEPVPDHIAKSMEFCRDVQDPKENSKGYPPANEQLRTHAIWIVEAYPPSEVARLVAALDALGGDSWRANGGERPAEWVLKARNQVRGWGGGLNLGYFVPTGATGYVGVEYRVNLPAGIKYVRAGLHQLLPSVTMGVFCFVLEEGSQLERAVEDSLRQTYATVPEKIGATRWRFHTPSNLRVAAAVKTRGELRAVCETWVGATLPGFFAPSRGRSGFTCEYITTVAQPLFERVVDDDGKPAHEVPSCEWLWSLHLDSPIDAWTSVHLEGLRLGYSYVNETAPYAWVIGGKVDDILANDELTKMTRERTRGAIVGRIVLGLDNDLAILGLATFIREISAQLAQLRDQTGRISINNGQQSAADLMKLQTRFTALSTDLLPIIDEVELFTEQGPRWPRSPDDDFIRLHEDLRKHGGLLANVRQDLREHSKRLRLLSTSLRESLAVAASALHANIQAESAAQNLSLQKAMRRLTVVALGIAALTIFIALPDAIDDWKAFLPRLIRRLAAWGGG